jgi:hypothetical protein
LNPVDLKLLWGRAGGMCSRPGCSEDLTAIVEKGAYIVGEMAHVMGRKPTARRGTVKGGSDKYENLILLCPTHHTHVDKAPEGTYPEELLYSWKAEHESAIRTAGKTERFAERSELKREIFRLLTANKAIFEALGPHSDVARVDPISNMFSIWQLRRLDRVLPNNRKILNLLDINRDLLRPSEMNVIEAFRIHAEAYEQHLYERLDRYPTFPKEFPNLFS